ncbi:tripartite tricarboxylate transporter TctB family protein [Haloplanus halophilus]|uniref:tripartite tricarboxylate transporter TctB family protein n=1 Tax=Haloplanus halophilus TaxID=2949993 RepID=UPI00203C4D4A|nr:tripartite tricarboxylate transporter TctB family protein [Haloplanus sp. GDY1]
MSRPDPDAEETSGTDALDELQSNEVPNRYVDGLITLGFIAGAVFFLYLSGDLGGISGSTYDPGAAFWPRVTLVTVLVAAVINLGLVVRRLRDGTEDDPGGIRPSLDGALGDLSDKRTQFGLAVVAVLLYLAALTPTGFVVSTPVFLFVFAWISGYRSPVRLLAFSLFTTLFLFALFRTLFNISLPYGNGPFREVSLFFEVLFNGLMP